MQSPFIYNKGTIKEDSSNITVEFGNINQMIKNNQIDDVDLRIITKIHEFKFTTAAVVGLAFKEEEFYSPNLGKKRLAKYMKYGLVRRFYTISNDKEESSKRSVNFYTLSESTMNYLKKYYKLKKYSLDEGNLANIGDVLSRISLNQFIVNANRNIEAITEMKHNDKSMRVASCLYNNEPTLIHVVRSDQNLANLCEKLNKSNKQYDNFILIIETENMGVDIISKLQNKLKNSELMFITDLMCVSETMNKSFLKILVDNNKSKTMEMVL